MKSPTTRTESTASAEELWAVLMDWRSYPAWNPTVVALEGEAALGTSLSASVATGSGRVMKFRPVVVEFEAGRKFAWQGKVILPQLLSAHHSFEVLPHGGGATFVHSEEFRGLLLPLLGSMLRDTERTQAAMNQALVAEVERRRLSSPESARLPTNALA
jgi:hypothetical protein